MENVQEKLKLGEACAKRELTEDEAQLVENFFLLAERTLSKIEKIEPTPWQRAARIGVLRRWAYEQPEETPGPAELWAKHVADLIVSLADEAIRMLGRAEGVDKIRLLCSAHQSDENDVPEEVLRERLDAIHAIVYDVSLQPFTNEILHQVEILRERDDRIRIDRTAFDEGYDAAVEHFTEALTLHGR